MDKVNVTTIKGFHNEGQYAPRGSSIKVHEQRARELERNGLVTRDDKAAQSGENKMAPEASNKRRSRGGAKP